MNIDYFFKSAKIYLPDIDSPLSKWAVIACDQYTSSIDYWFNVKKEVGNAPSTLNLIYPEVYLNTDINVNIKDIYNNMNKYINDKIIVPAFEDGLILVERETTSGKRIGIVGVIDLEKYSFTDNSYPIIATEDIVKNRLDKRIEIRTNASIELPHTILFLLDKTKTIIENAYKECLKSDPIYDFDLMMNGGHIRGFKIEGELKNRLLDAINNKIDSPSIIVGDGNHSLASSKLCYEKFKQNNQNDSNTPLRFALIELENLFSDSVEFFPIHRFLFNKSVKDVSYDFNYYLKKNNIESKGIYKVILKDERDSFEFYFESSIECIKIVQSFIESKGYMCDYPHEEKEINNLLKEQKGTAILLNSIDKDELLLWIKENGHLPKKSFSIGKADDKRFYLESRVIK